MDTSQNIMLSEGSQRQKESMLCNSTDVKLPGAEGWVKALTAQRQSMMGMM